VTNLSLTSALDASIFPKRDWNSLCESEAFLLQACIATRS